MPENFSLVDMFAMLQKQMERNHADNLERLDGINSRLDRLNGQTSKNTEGVFEGRVLIEDARGRIEDLEAWQSAPLRMVPKQESAQSKSEEDRVWTLRDAKLLGYGAGGVFALLKALPWLLSLAKP